MAKIIKWILFNDKEFLKMLSEQALNSSNAMKELASLISQFEKIDKNGRKSKISLIGELEANADKLTQSIIEKIEKSYPATAKKELIIRTAILLDDLIDSAYDAALKFSILGIERIDKHIEIIAGLANESINEIDSCVRDLKSLRKSDSRLIKIREIESRAENCLNDALSDLFHYYKNSIDLIKYKEIYGILKSITDKCSELSFLIERALIKGR